MLVVPILSMCTYNQQLVLILHYGPDAAASRIYLLGVCCVNVLATASGGLLPLIGADSKHDHTDLSLLASNSGVYNFSCGTELPAQIRGIRLDANTGSRTLVQRGAGEALPGRTGDRRR
jgi:hypothetical protein